MDGSRTRSDGRRLSAAGLIIVTAGTLLLMAWAIFPKPALADGTVTWTGNGSEHNEPCREGEDPGFHWVFTTGGGTSAVTAANLFVNGNGPFAMSPNPQFTQFDADVVSGEVVSAQVNYVGTLGNGNAVLTISHGCFGEETTTTETTTTPPSTSTTPPSTSTTPPSTSTTPPSTSTTPPSTSTYPPSTSTTVAPTTITPPPDDSETVDPTTVAPPKGTAFTGPENVIPLGVIALTMMTTGSGLLWAGTRRGRRDEHQD